MNLYLLEISENFKHDQWDYYDCCVVAAENESKAKLIHPFLDSLNDKKSDFASWPSLQELDYINCKLLAENVNLESGVICAQGQNS